jgi:hypothetical protein
MKSIKLNMAVFLMLYITDINFIQNFVKYPPLKVESVRR